MEDVMLLSDATSREQVEAALAAGDEELREDIEEQISSSLATIANVGLDYDTDNIEDIEDIVKNSDDFMQAILQQSKPDLSQLPEEVVSDALAFQANYGRSGEAGIFKWKEGRGWRRSEFGFEWSYHPGESVWLSKTKLFDNHELVPANFAHGFYEGLGSRFEWSEGTGVIREQSGWHDSYEIASIVFLPHLRQRYEQ